MLVRALALILSFVFVACSHTPSQPKGENKLIYPGEVHFSNLRQLTFGGTNAEAYWSFDGKALTFQHKAFDGPPACDQIYVMRDDGTKLRAVTQEARTTCSYFLPGNSRVLYSSTMSGGKECPPDPDKSRGYVWPIFDTYQVYSANPDGSDPRPLEPGAPRAYNAEATVCKDGSVIFTSDRDGDLELYRGTLDSFGTMIDVKRLTFTPGYDGGAFFSQDCRQIVWRASRPKPGKELEEYQALLKQHLVRPSKLEIWVADADGSHARQVTRVGAASFAPFFTPDSKRILFASNPRDPRGRHFDIYSIRVDGTGLERVTFSDTFESFPMFSPDGKRLAFSSNRDASRAHETNVFVADWVETPEKPLSIDSPEAADRVAAWSANIAEADQKTAGRVVAEQLKKIGLKLVSDERGTLPVIAQAGAKCGTKRGVVSANLADPLSIAALFEAAKFAQEQTKAVGCATFVIAAGAPDETPAAIKKLKPVATLSLSNISTMEGNSVFVQIPSGLDPKSEKRVREAFEAACSELALNCTLSAGQPGGGAFRVSAQDPGKAPASGSPVNATGAVQVAELASVVIIRAASK